MQVVVLTVRPKRCQTRRLSSYALAQGMSLCRNSTRLQVFADSGEAGIYWCLILVAAEVRFLWSAPGLCVHLVQVVIKSVRGSVQSAPSFESVSK
jgi:hypothetical protein